MDITEKPLEPVNGHNKQRRESSDSKKAQEKLQQQTKSGQDQSRSKSVEGKNKDKSGKMSVEEKRKSAPVRPVENIDEWKKGAIVKQESLEEKTR